MLVTLETIEVSAIQNMVCKALQLENQACLVHDTVLYLQQRLEAHCLFQMTFLFQSSFLRKEQCVGFRSATNSWYPGW